MAPTHKVKINNVIDLIQNNLDQDLPIKYLAKSCNLSHFYLAHLFKSTLGESIHAFIKRLRMEKSAAMLVMNSNIPITEIALKCGFSNPSSFAKCFKQFYNISAYQWRKQQKLADLAQHKNLPHTEFKKTIIDAKWV